MQILNNRLKVDIDSGNKIFLELGSGGKSSKSGYYALDLLPLDGVDVVADLSEKFDQIPDNSVFGIYSRHTLEHVPDILGLMQEIHRICHKDALIEIIVPHFSNVFGFSDPTHVRFFGFFSFYYFTDADDQPMKKRKVPAFYTPIRFTVEKIKIDFYRISWLDILLEPIFKYWVNYSFKTQIYFERRWSGIFHAWQIRYTIKPKKS